MGLDRRALLALLAGVPAIGCSRQALVYDARNVEFGGDASLPARSLQIRRAGLGQGWAMEDVRPGIVRGTLDLRAHQAVVDVAYDRRRFSIFHAASQRMRYTGREIHRNYNLWVQQLEQAVVAQSPA